MILKSSQQKKYGNQKKQLMRYWWRGDIACRKQSYLNSMFHLMNS